MHAIRNGTKQHNLDQMYGDYHSNLCDYTVYHVPNFEIKKLTVKKALQVLKGISKMISIKQRT